MYILAGLLLLGLVANALLKPLAARWFMSGEEIPTPKSQTPSPNITATMGIRDLGLGAWDFARVAAAWAAVGIPIAWGVWVTLSQALVLFSGGA